jgi:hypothetical protein
MLMFTLGFLSGSYMSFVVASYITLTIINIESPVYDRVMESILWPYYLLSMLFGKDEE